MLKWRAMDASRPGGGCYDEEPIDSYCKPLDNDAGYCDVMLQGNDNDVATVDDDLCDH